MNYRTLVIAFFCMIIYSCAVESPPTGGLSDKESPYIKIVNPENGTVNIGPNQSIEIFFNEMIDPKTVKSSIEIFPEIDIKINISRKKITLKPSKNWPDEAFRINVLRGISDFHGNTLNNSKGLFYSSSLSIPTGKISGKIFNFNQFSPSKIGLFQIEDSLKLVATTENNYLNEFKFDYVPNGDYAIIGIEGDIKNIYDDIKFYNYAISNNKIRVNNNYIPGIKLNYSYPSNRKNIKSFQFKNDSYGIAQLNDGSIINVIDKKYFEDGTLYSEDISFFESGQANDSVLVSISLENKIESYSINKVVYFNKGLLDTIPPVIQSNEIIDNKMIVTFSEPLVINDNAELFSTLNSDSTFSNLEYKVSSPIRVEIIKLLTEMNLIKINNNLIKDYAGNNLTDSLLVTNLNNSIVKNLPKGNIFGKIIYEGRNKIIVEAVNVLGEKFKAKINKYNEFSFLDLDVGEYKIWAYEDLNELNDGYFNGTLVPLKYSAKFNYYNEPIQTRANWDIEDVRIWID